jgi:hypothetical protein
MFRCLSERKFKNFWLWRSIAVFWKALFSSRLALGKSADIDVSGHVFGLPQVRHIYEIVDVRAAV